MSNPFDSTIPQHVSVRPLNKGMFQNLPSNGLPDGGFWRIQNYRVESQGLSRRGGFVDFNLNAGTGEDVYNEKLLDIIYFYQRSGSALQLLLTDRKLYRMGSDGTIIHEKFVQFSKTISDTVAETDSFIITIPGTIEESENILRFDAVEIDSVYFEVETVLYIPGDTIEVRLTGVVLDDALNGETANFETRFLSEKRLGPTYAVLPSVSGATEDKVIIVDQGGRGLFQYTLGGGLQYFDIDSTDGIGGTTNYVTGGKTLTYFDDRIWVGNTEEVDGEYRQRIRWSDAVDFDRFAPASYVDLPYTEGELLRLVPMGSLLVAYFRDAVYLGRRTNLYNQPYFFERLETGNVGLLNSRAVVRHIDAHYFVSESNIYQLSGTGGLQQIGAPILDEALHFTKEKGLLSQVQVEHDPVAESIVFFFPDREEFAYPNIPGLATRLWRFYYRTNSWAYDEVSFPTADKVDPSFYFSAVLPSNTYVFGRSWEDWEDLEDTPGYDVSWNEDIDVDDPNYPNLPDESFQDYGTWANLMDDRRLGVTLKIGMLSAPLQREVIVEESDTMEQDTIGGTDYPIWSLIESGDHDYGMPDYTKTVNRFSVKAMHIYSERESPLIDVGGEFTLNISDAMGYHWKRPVTLRFRNNYNEGYANFRSTGSTFRFKLINSQVIAPYRLSEYIMRIVGRGLQVEN